MIDVFACLVRSDRTGDSLTIEGTCRLLSEGAVFSICMNGSAFDVTIPDSSPVMPGLRRLVEGEEADEPLQLGQPVIGDEAQQIA